MTGIWRVNRQGGTLGREGWQHVWKGVCTDCEGTGEKHEVDVRGWYGKSTGKVKGRGRMSGEWQEKGWTGCGECEANGRGLAGQKFEKNWS